MTTTLRVGTIADDDMLKGPHDRRRRLLADVRESGLDHVFVADHVSFHTGFGLDGMIQAAQLTALDPSLRVHIGVYLLALRHPVPVARQIAQIAESAPGRLHLGVGIGGEDRHEIEICGVDPSTRGRHTNESLAALRKLLAGEPTSHDCDFFSFEEALILPAPAPAVPIVIGGRVEAAIRRAALLGDGWLGVWCSPKRYAQVVDQIDVIAADRSIPRPETWDHGLQVWVGLDADRDRARSFVKKRMEAMYRIPFERFEKYSPYGPAEEIASFLAPYVEAGCRHFNVMPVGESAEACVEGVAEVKRLLA